MRPYAARVTCPGQRIRYARTEAAAARAAVHLIEFEGHPEATARADWADGVALWVRDDGEGWWHVPIEAWWPRSWEPRR